MKAYCTEFDFVEVHCHIYYKQSLFGESLVPIPSDVPASTRFVTVWEY